MPRGGKISEYTGHLRRIVVARPNKDTPLILVTNRFDLPATSTSNLYKQRWGIELIFRWLKQHLKIRKFMGRTENTVKIQIITVLIAYMLLTLFKSLSQTKSTMHELLIIVKETLLAREIKNYYREKQQNISALELNQLEFSYSYKIA